MPFDIRRFLALSDLAPPAPGTPLKEMPAYRVAEVAVGAAVFDGELDLAEDDDLLAQIQALPGLAAFDGSALNELMDEVVGTGDELPADFESVFIAGLADAARHLPSPSLRAAAYELSVHFAAWDGELSDAEVRMLSAMATAFEIDQAEAERLKQAVMAA